MEGAAFGDIVNYDSFDVHCDLTLRHVHQRRRENKIWFKGRLVKYPFENDLASLPKEDNFDCIYGYIVNPHANEKPTSLAQWSYVTFGEGISDKYFIPYNRKIWNYDPWKIGLEFVSRIPKPQSISTRVLPTSTRRPLPSLPLPSDANRILTGQ